ncbi:hypothetical protein JCM10914A_47350 [Paenibacillus sp. JCM 10914]|uniref:hypothetical protein n=1 Tax=Paenibacillus sp. JCM 10914 TaxID=1236974 RepID=UPI0003CC6AE2|nr:hypothetical protein [Paenibacillus sp. JCM 10914]GAE08075.1 hypothetical protein JCM10914_4335 [Paenibacillus sp. JCM 10914]
MNQRFRITRSMQPDASAQEISLEECHVYFSSKADFTYQTVLTVKGEESTMSIEGDFFIWNHGEAFIPFRHYMGELYVAVSHQELIPLMIEIATDFRADIVEG